MISQYQVGQMPAQPLAINVYDSRNNARDLSAYTSHTVRLIDPQDNEVDLGNGVLQTLGARFGRFVLVWPTNKSLFDMPGDYLLQLVFTGTGKKDFTTTHTVRVRQVGRF